MSTIDLSHKAKEARSQPEWARSSRIRLSEQRHNQRRTYTDRRHEHYASQEPITLGTSTFESATIGVCSDRRGAALRWFAQRAAENAADNGMSA